MHRVGRVLSFFSSRRNWDSPTPSAAGEYAPPLGPGKGAHSACGRGDGRVPIPTRGHTLWCSIYIITLCLYGSLNASLCCIQRVLRKVEKRAKVSLRSPIIRIWLSVFQLENGGECWGGNITVSVSV
jgi:hypothetical protein